MVVLLLCATCMGCAILNATPEYIANGNISGELSIASPLPVLAGLCRSSTVHHRSLTAFGELNPDPGIFI
jgi:hypothetical protein